jgi:hypothetical protein
MRRRGPENINFWWGMWWIAVAIFFLGIVCLLTGCGDKSEEANRFTMTLIEDTDVGRFSVIEDTETGDRYLYMSRASGYSGMALMPNPVEEETFTGETEAMVFGSAAPEIVDIAVETVETVEQPESNTKIIHNKVNWPGGPRQGEPDRAGRRPGPEGGLGNVVRCEDCKWIDEDGDCAHEEMLDQSGYPKSVKKDFFCGHGEKRAFDGDYVKYGKRRRADNG